MELREQREQGGRKRDALALGGLFALIFIPFILRAARGMTALADPLEHDIGFQWVPFHDFIRRAFTDGVLPLWSPEIFAGFPFAAFSHGSVFYPPGLLFLLGDYARVVNLYYPLHLCVAAAGVFLLVRALRVERLPAFAAAAAYVFTGKPFHFIHFLPATQSNVWLPWLILGALWAARGQARGIAVGAAAFGLAILGGDVESTAYGLCFSAAALIILLKDEDLPRRRLLIAAVPLALGALLAAAQLVPLTELSRWFVRNQGVTFDYFSQRELPPAVAYAVFAPARAIGDFPFKAPYFYLGAAVFGLATAAAWGRARRSSRPLLLLTAFAFAFSFGSIPAIDRLQYAFPVLRSFGSPEQSFFVGQLLLVVLAAQGLDAAGRDRRGLALAGVGLIVFTTVEALIGARDGLMAWGWIGFLATALAGARTVARASSPRPERPTAWKAMPLMAAALVFDLWLLAVFYLPKDSPLNLVFDPPLLSHLAHQLPHASGRAAFVSRLGLSDHDLLHHAGMSHDFDLIDGWITTPIRSYAEVLALADPRVARFKDGKLDSLGLNADLRDGRFIDAPGMPILDLIGLRTIIDHGLPLKFSSPAFLNFVPPEYRWRLVRKGPSRTEGFSGVIDDDVNQPNTGYREIMGHAFPGYEYIEFAPNEVMRLRLFISPGDRLRFGLYALGTPGNFIRASVEARPIGGNTIALYHQELQTALPIRDVTPWRREASSENSEPVTIDLHALAGREIELTFTTSSERPRVRGDVIWFEAAIVNPDRPLQFRPAGEDSFMPDLVVFQNRDALPRGFLARDFEVVPPGDDLARLKAMPAYDLRRKLILARAPRTAAGDELRPAAGAKAGKAARLTARRSGEEVWTVEAAQPALLFVSDQYYPGWRAFVGDREEPIVRADHAFRAVPVGPGDREVRFVFQPASVRVGLWMSLSSALALAAMVVAQQRKVKGKK